MQKKKDIFIYFLTFLSIILASYIFSKINLTYNNPEEVLGYYSYFNYSHFNDTVKYLIFVGIPLFVFLISFIIVKKKECLNLSEIFRNLSIKLPRKNLLLNFVLFLFVALIIIDFFSTEFPNFKLDVFHEGQLLSGAYNFYLSKELWKSTYVISGLFMDILNANISWSFSDQENIASYRFYIFFLQSLTSIVFLIFCYLISKAFNFEKNKEVLFFLILSALSLSLINDGTVVFRDLTLGLFLIFCLMVLKSYDKNQIICFLLGFLSIFSLLWSLDRGIYLNATLLCFVIILFFKKKNYQIFLITLSILLSWLMFFLIVGKDEFIGFINHSFTVLKHMDLQHGVMYPTPFSDETNASRATKNLLIIIANGMFIISALLNKNSNIPRETKLFLATLFILSSLFYKTGLSRSDGPHLKQAISFHIILFVIFVYLHVVNYYQNNLKNIKLKFFLEKYFILLLILIFILQNNINNNLKNTLNFKERYLTFINLDNDTFLIEEDRKTLNRLKDLTENENCFQLFNYHTAFTYLLKKKSCSKFSHIFNLGSKKHQYDFISEMEDKKPKYILYEKKSDSSENINNNDKKFEYSFYSFILPSERFPYINKYILKNYSILEEINGWPILQRKED